jgi:uncharacterized protein with PQ loop repeat
MALTILDILGLTGNIFAIIFFVLPVLIIIELCKKKDTSKITWLLFLFTILNCELWMIYGLKINAWPVSVCNGFGLFSNFFFLLIYLMFLDLGNFIKFIYLLSILSGILIVHIIFYIYVKKNELVGILACVFNVMMFAAPLQNISKVYELKDNTFIPIHISIILLLNTITWTSYGILKSMDYFIIIPNVLGFLLTTFQIYLWFIFKKPDIQIKNDDIKSTNEFDEGQKLICHEDDLKKNNEKDYVDIKSEVKN